jgi:solute carrier family 35 protein F5
MFNRFAANVTINMALAQTSVSSVTILSSLSGLFTLALGSLFGIERFNTIRLLAVAASIAGVVLVSKADDIIIPTDMEDPNAPHDPRIPLRPIFGDILAIISALCYAMYTLLLKAKTGDETRISSVSFQYKYSMISLIVDSLYCSMTLFFGFVGA